MDAFRIIELTEGKEAAEEFRRYLNKLDIRADVQAKISVFDLTHPLYQHGFHPAFAYHMIQYNDQQTSKSSPS